jgi:hypothetical protein
LVNDISVNDVNGAHVGVGGHATTASPDLGLIQFVVVVVIVVAVVVDIIEVIALIYGFLRRGS